MAARAHNGEIVQVTLELDSGYRTVEMHPELEGTLARVGLSEVFAELSYSKRKEFARQVNEAKADDTRLRRIEKVIESLRAEKPVKK